MKVFVTVVAAGFPVALVIAWAFELTPEGMKRTEHIPRDEKLPSRRRRKFAALIASLALLAAGLLAYQLLRARGSGTNPDLNNKSIAVLPFANLSDDKGSAYFVDGMQDEVVTRLAKIGAPGSSVRSAMGLRKRLMAYRTESSMILFLGR